MSFNPLGSFNVDAPLNDDALHVARAMLHELPAVPQGDLTRVYLHWSAATYGCTFGEYNAMVTLEDGKWVLSLTHDPRDNAVSTFSDEGYAAHSFHRNTGGLGICISGMDGADYNHFGSDPIQMHEIEFLCAGAAALCSKYDIDVSGLSVDTVHNGAYSGEPNVLTHAEIASLPGDPAQYDPYFGERWDLACLVALPEGMSATPEMATTTGNALRRRCHSYKRAL